MNYAKIPYEEEALELLTEYGVDRKIIEHSKAVYKKALELTEKIVRNGHTVNTDLVRAGALLHDIGRHKENSIRHGIIGGELLQKLGYPLELARIVERHVLCGIANEFAKRFDFPDGRKFIPETIEELIICYADKLIAGRHSVDLKKRFSFWIKKYGKNPLLEESIRRTKRVEKRVLELMGTNPSKDFNE